MNVVADRGGSFGCCAESPMVNWMRREAPGIGQRLAAESSPIGSDDAARRERTRRRRHLYWLVAILAIFCAGIAAFGHGIYIFAKANLAQAMLHAAWNRTQATGAPIKPWPWADTFPVARLAAPAQKSDLLVLSGASGRTLAFGPGHLDGSVLPGDIGNSVIVAHRDTHFRFLQRVTVDDVLVVERSNGTRVPFHVRWAYVTDSRALDIPRDAIVPTLTLVTCYPFDAINPGGPLRYVVVAEAM